MPDPAAPGSARVLALMPGAFAGLADQLRAAFAKAAPGVGLEFHAFVPSGALARELLDGAPGDVYVSANPHFMRQVHAAGLVPEPRVLAGNRLCVIVHPRRAGTVRSIDDLARPDLRVVAPQPVTDPCGRYVVELLEQAGLVEGMRAKAEAATFLHSNGSGDLPGFLMDGRADAGVLYLSEARRLADSVEVVTLTPELDGHERITFMVGAVRRGGDVHDGAEALVTMMVGSTGQAILTTAGFLPAGEAPDPGPLA